MVPRGPNRLVTWPLQMRLCWVAGWNAATVKPGAAACGEELQDNPFLLPARGHDAQDALQGPRPCSSAGTRPRADIGA